MASKAHQKSIEWGRTKQPTERQHVKQHDRHNCGQCDASVVLTNSWPKGHAKTEPERPEPQSENPADRFLGDDPQYLKEKEGEGRVSSEWHLFIPGTCAHKGPGAHQQRSPCCRSGFPAQPREIPPVVQTEERFSNGGPRHTEGTRLLAPIPQHF